MKISPNLLKNFPAGMLGLVFALLSAVSAHAQILLTVDVTHPDAVVITATGAGPSTSVDSQLIAYGVDLQAFFTGNVDPSVSYPATTTTLTTGDASSGPVFNTSSSDETGGEIANVDLNLYQNFTDATITFTSGQPAFTGTLTLSLSGTGLPSAGTTGAVLAGDSLVGTTPIGSYVVVVAPEPSTWMLILCGVGAIAVVRRLRVRA